MTGIGEVELTGGGVEAFEAFQPLQDVITSLLVVGS